MLRASLLTLDISIVTGAAYDLGDDTPRFESFRAPQPEGSGEEGWDYSRTFGHYARWLRGKIADLAPQLIAFEAPLQLLSGRDSKVFTSQTTIRVLFGLAAITEEVAFTANTPTVEVNVQTVKRSFAGTGRADKPAMIARCRQLNWPVKNDHEADAAGIYTHVRSLRDPSWAPRATPLFGHRSTFLNSGDHKS